MHIKRIHASKYQNIKTVQSTPLHSTPPHSGRVHPSSWTLRLFSTCATPALICRCFLSRARQMKVDHTRDMVRLSMLDSAGDSAEDSSSCLGSFTGLVPEEEEEQAAPSTPLDQVEAFPDRVGGLEPGEFFFFCVSRGVFFFRFFFSPFSHKWLYLR